MGEQVQKKEQSAIYMVNIHACLTWDVCLRGVPGVRAGPLLVVPVQRTGIDRHLHVVKGDFRKGVAVHLYQHVSSLYSYMYQVDVSPT